MNIVLVVLGFIIFIAAGASALSRLATSPHQEKKPLRPPLIIAIVGVVLMVTGGLVV